MHATDPVAGPGIVDGLRERQYIDRIVRRMSYDGVAPGFPRLSRAAAALLAAPDGPRVAELNWMAGTPIPASHAAWRNRCKRSTKASPNYEKA